MIKLLNDHYISNEDGMNWKVFKRSKILDKKAKHYGKDYDTVLGYYPTIGTAMYGFVQKSLKEEDAKSFADIMKKLEEVYKLCIDSSRNVKTKKVSIQQSII